MAQGYAGRGHARLQAFLDDLGFERFGIRSSLAHGNPEDKGDGVHVFLSGEHRPYRRDRVGDFAGRLHCLYRFAHITAMVESIFGSDEKAMQWLSKPKDRFSGKSPLSMLTTTQGASQVEEMLIQLAEGFAF